MKIVLNLKYMKKDVQNPKELFQNIFALTNDYIMTSNIMRMEYNIIVSIKPTSEDECS